MAIFFLAKNGYGSVEDIEKWDSPRFLNALEYESICHDIISYEQTKAAQ